MAPIDFADKPVRLIMENEIVSDIVYEDDTIKSRISLVLRKLEKSTDDPRDFFIVVLEKISNKIKGIITFEDLANLTTAFEKDKKLTFKKFVSSPTVILYTESIQKTIKLFESKDVNIVLVKNEDESYVGKVKRTTLDKRLSDLVNTFRS
ncbi:MAG: hypothetical protein ACP5N1_03445 [Candidatus Woesearchaeota archaeon]